jgi:hypothetical protein
MKNNAIYHNDHYNNVRYASTIFYIYDMMEPYIDDDLYISQHDIIESVDAVFDVSAVMNRNDDVG